MTPSWCAIPSSAVNVPPLVILGSARPDGETRKAVDIAFAGRADLIILADRNIGGYDYSHRNDGDDFRSVVRAMLAHDRLVFATPVYWYAMSAPMKIFFDRLTDLLETAKTDGRAMKDKRCWMIATGTEETLPEGFETPFRGTAEYFGMTYHGCGYLYTGTDADRRAADEAVLSKFGAAI
jgi:multimeric flavodoxin WrbA